MSSGSHSSEKKRSPSPYEQRAAGDAANTEPETKKHRSHGPAESESDEILYSMASNGHKKNGKHADADPDQDSARSESTSQAIHGLDENYIKDVVEKIYRLRMPQDFFDFWDFCCRTNPMNPRMALSGVGVELVGPFDILAGDVYHKPSNLTELQDLAMLHWRYYYDVPEFQTCLRVTDSGSHLHYGYFRDDSNELPVFVASNEAGKDCKIYDHGPNLFSAVHDLIEKATDDEKIEDRSALKELQEVLTLHAHKFKHTLATAHDTRSRRSAITSFTLHGAGLVGKTPGENLEKRHHMNSEKLDRLFSDACYENDGEDGKAQNQERHSDEKLFALSKGIEKDIQHSVVDTTLEFGIDLFCHGNICLHKYAKEYLTKGYKLLERELFAEIGAKHVENRVRGDQLSKLPMK